MRTETRVRLHLQASHFRTMDQQKTGLVLRCTARIGNFYHVYTEITLGTPYKDPVPERGRFECSSCFIFSLTSFRLLYHWPLRLTIWNAISQPNIAPAGRIIISIQSGLLSFSLIRSYVHEWPSQSNAEFMQTDPYFRTIFGIVLLRWEIIDATVNSRWTYCQFIAASPGNESLKWMNREHFIFRL